MKKLIRLGLCLGMLTAALTCSALAATEGYTTDSAGTVDYAGGKYTASYTGATSGNQYVILVVKGSASDYSISENTIMYIDQKAAESETISFNFIPKSTPDCVVLLGGEFSDGQSPKVLGTLIGQGVTVSGKVTLQGRSDYSGATATLSGKDGGKTYTATTNSAGIYTFDSVPVGEYTLTITMPGYLSYTKTALAVEDITQVAEKNLLGGDVNEVADSYVNADDLLVILDNFIQAVQYPGMDINGDGYINADELSIILGNFAKYSVTE